MTATIGNATSGSRPELIKATHRRLRRMGFGGAEAANLAAFRAGLGITSQPWTVRELLHLLFLGESCRAGRWWSDAHDRADSTDWTPVAAVLDRASAPAVVGGGRVPSVESRYGHDATQSDGRVTLLTLFRSMAGPNARFDLLPPSGPPGLDAAGGSEREGG